MKKAKTQASVICGGKTMAFTAVFLEVPKGYVGFVEELPGANTQGATLDEARRNLKESIRLVLEANRKFAEEEIDDKRVIREKIEVSLR
jgi:predicted RNase H-like HicB family nuclease